ncbi:AraC family transcriptional regulator [Paenibacillus sp. IB182496]|uniref:AraC family transcriptional regulator n=1 Tax=Paenibacillus sabuli TaxID=2772509 RepID=A0A927BQG8_9BACL|nr:AraC family transcriptional regulator [Paenibacillus sabuli]MBD2843684.1 AraC family transcriptional regulator [Paenibacillus sabuli]
MTVWADGVPYIPSQTVYGMFSMLRSTLAAGQTLPLETGERPGLLIVVEGRGAVADRRLLLEAGDSWLLEPHARVELEIVAGGRRLCCYFLVICSMSASGVAIDALSPGGAAYWSGPRRIKPTAGFLREVDALYTAAEQGGAWLQQFKLQLQFQSLLYRLLAWDVPRESEQDSLGAVRDSIAFLQAHYDEAITVAQLAGRLNLSSRQYTRLFKKLTGKTPIEFLNEYRINRSREMLLQSNVPSHHISSKIGMKDVTYFNRRFKQLVGCSPKAYVRKRDLDTRIVTLHYAGEMLALGMLPLASLENGLRQLQPGAPAIDSIGYDSCRNDRVNALRPDLIIASDFVNRQELAALGDAAPVIIIPWDQNAFDRLHSVARVLGKEREAEQWQKRYLRRRHAVHRACRGLPHCTESAAIVRLESDRAWVHAARFFPTFYEVIGFRPTPLMTVTTEADPAIRRTQVPLHRIEEMEADRLYIVEDDGPAFASNMERLCQTDGWERISAVRKRHVYKLAQCGISNSAYTLEWQLRAVSRLIDPRRTGLRSEALVTPLL